MNKGTGVGGSGRTFPCQNCGGELEWNPSKQEMQCPYCDSLIPVPRVESFEAEEHDLLSFLEDHPKIEGYGVQLSKFSCKQCGATVKVPPGRVDLTCPFCATKFVLEDASTSEDVVKPESMLPFKIDLKESRNIFKRWIGKGWFRPNDLKKMGKLEKVLGLYLPFFTFDSNADSTWTAMAGYYYYVTKRVPVTENGKTVWKTRQVRKIRWEPASGSRHDFYDDVLVPAVADERLELILKIYPYDTKHSLVAFDKRYLAGFGILGSDMDLKRVYLIAKQNMESDQRKLCAGDVPGDTHKNLNVLTRLSKQTFKHILCPVWAGSFMYKKQVFPFVINGQTGRVYGRKPWSWVKISLACAFAAIVAFLVYWFFLRGGG